MYICIYIYIYVYLCNEDNKNNDESNIDGLLNEGDTYVYLCIYLAIIEALYVQIHI
jgi:hypothetical protein